MRVFERQKYLIIIVLSIAVLLAATMFFLNRYTGIYLEGRDKELIRRLFGIKKSQYKIIEVENRLENSEYGGRYRVTLKVCEEQMEDFQKELEQTFGEPLSEEEKDDDRIYIWNGTGIEPDVNDLVYHGLSEVKRSIYGPAKEVPKTCSSTIVCLKPVDGISKVVMNYSE